MSDVKGKAPVTDPKVVNPWGLAMGKTLWVSNTGTGTATVYSGTGKKEKTEVAIPGGAPTGQVFNPGQGFTVKGKPASFIFSSPSGAISGWNAEVDPANAIIAAFTRGADYKGLELVQTEDEAFLLAADFAGGRIHAFDQDFRRVKLARWQFRDSALPKGYNAYNVAVANGNIWVAYALRDPATGKPVFGNGKGFVSRFNANGRLTGRISRVGLNAPLGTDRRAQGLGPRVRGLAAGRQLRRRHGARVQAGPAPRRPARLRWQADRAARALGPRAGHRRHRRREGPVVLRRHRRHQARPDRRDRAEGHEGQLERGGRGAEAVGPEDERPSDPAPSQNPYGGY
ncbi:TIGR03118 family protein [Nonomuraea salmonea]|uniref:TIGR03118 family protein n=1 Tax=Nonomuraea salmonea TaxID=46181 RepID=UPI0031EC76F3